LIAALAAPAYAQEEISPSDPQVVEQRLVPFVDNYCAGCHNAERKKGGLVLEGLEARFDRSGSALWTRVFERLEAGEMPPEGRDQPTQAEREGVLEWLQHNLLEADLARRSSIRRLNRYEYENTLRDLLGIDLPLKEMLPEDGVAHGFDNVGSALAISTELMGAYLECADRALDAAIASGPEPRSVHLEQTLHETARTPEGGTLLDIGDAVVVFSSGGYVPTDFPFIASVEGDYRLRIRAHAWQSDEPQVMVVRTINYQRDIRRVVGYYEVGAQPRSFEMVQRLIPGDQIKITPHGLFFQGLPDPEFNAGPGIAIGGLEIEGPLHDPWPPGSHGMLFGDVDPSRATPADGERILARFVPRAFRRSAGPEEIAPYVALLEQSLAAGSDFEAGLRVALKAVLCSPDFLFVGDPAQRPGQPLGASALATQLSYFLWSSMPDAALRAAAESGRLREPEVLAQQVERMLADPKARAFTENFTGQWLDLRDIDFTTPDEDLYPEFDELLQVSSVEETQRFFQEILDHDLSILNFIDSPFSMLNGRLAEHYGIEGVEGLEFRRVSLPAASHRGGVLTQASILRVTANGTNTSPVLRGVWVLENIIGKPSPPPPAGVGAVEPDTRGATTLREQLAKHRDIETCNSCHQRIDPPGFALESFDVIGGWRERYRSMMGKGETVDKTVRSRRVRYKHGPRVDSTGQVADGTTFRDIDEFKRLLLADHEQIARCLIEKLWVYATGREPGFADRLQIEDILRRSAAEEYGFRTLIHEIARSF
jgi:hypothetical protein